MTSFLILLYIPLKINLYVYWISFSVILFTNLLITIELIVAIYNYIRMMHDRQIMVRPSTTPGRNRNINPDINMGVIIPAFLPNEYPVLIDTLKSYNYIDYPYGKIILILVTNGQIPNLEWVNMIKNLRNTDIPTSNLEIHHNHLVTSHSKAENINHGITFLQNLNLKYISIFDADHQPERNSFILAINIMHFNLGYHVNNNGGKSVDMVQGRCLIRNNSILNMEFQEIYLIHHWAGTTIRRYSLFGGSNAFWRTEALSDIRMSDKMLTEDIDAGIRAWLKNYNLAFCPGIISYELAPTGIKSLYHQRIRWAQGWLQVTLKHTKEILTSNKSIWEKVVAFFLFPYREFHHYLSLNVLPAFVTYYIRTQTIDLELLNLSYLILIFELFKILIVLIGGYLNGKSITIKQVLLYLTVLFPYEIFKHIITLEAHFRNMIGVKTCVLTRV